jgi:hypothetical protein
MVPLHKRYDHQHIPLVCAWQVPALPRPLQPPGGDLGQPPTRQLPGALCGRGLRLWRPAHQVSDTRVRTLDAQESDMKCLRCTQVPGLRLALCSAHDWCVLQGTAPSVQQQYASVCRVVSLQACRHQHQLTHPRALCSPCHPQACTPVSRHADAGHRAPRQGG